MDMILLYTIKCLLDLDKLDKTVNIVDLIDSPSSLYRLSNDCIVPHFINGMWHGSKFGL